MERGMVGLQRSNAKLGALCVSTAELRVPASDTTHEHALLEALAATHVCTHTPLLAQSGTNAYLVTLLDAPEPSIGPAPIGLQIKLREDAPILASPACTTPLSAIDCTVTHGSHTAAAPGRADDPSPASLRLTMPAWKPRMLRPAISVRAVQAAGSRPCRAPSHVLAASLVRTLAHVYVCAGASIVLENGVVLDVVAVVPADALAVQIVSTTRFAVSVDHGEAPATTWADSATGLRPGSAATPQRNLGVGSRALGTSVGSPSPGGTLMSPSTDPRVRATPAPARWSSRRAGSEGQSPAGSPSIAAVSPVRCSTPTSAVSIIPETLPAMVSTASVSVKGLDVPLAQLRECLVWPVLHESLVSHLRAWIPSGILLHGPPGVGKTLLVHSICEELRGLRHGADGRAAVDVLLLPVNGPELITGVVGETEERLRAVFGRADRHILGTTEDRLTKKARVAVIFIDETDALCPKRSADGPQTAANGGSRDPFTARIVTALLVLLDGSTRRGAATSASRVVVIGATNRPDALDAALRRPGRLDREIRIDPPDELTRCDILRACCEGIKLSAGLDDCLPTLARTCVGFVGADLQSLVREAAKAARQRWSTRVDSEESDLAVTREDFDTALRIVQPSALRGVVPSREKITWDEIGGMVETITRLRQAVELPLMHAAGYRRMRVHVPRGILLYGPPGNSKTTLVRALSCAIHAAFYALSGADVYSPYVGDAEKTIRDVFARARLTTPSIIFLDEIDALVGRRGIGGHETHNVSTSVLATLLTEMDGVQTAEGVLVIGATNRRDALDPALLRPGRLEIQIEVPMPDEPSRADILRVHTKRLLLSEEIDLQSLARHTEGWSGAELAGLCREAGMFAIRESVHTAGISQAHFEAALSSHAHARALLT